MTPTQRYHTILASICKRDGLCFKSAKMRGLRGDFSWARFEAWSKLRQETGMSYPRIAEIAGMDHTSVIYGIRQWEQRNPPVKWAFKSIRSAA